MTTDKRRIDACLKACEGISTQNLEDNVPFLELARRYNVVLCERDALRAKIERMGKQTPRETIERMLTQLMDIAVSNGANSVSMPDEYVEVAAWLCGIPAQPAPSVPTALLVAVADLAAQIEIVSRVGFVDTPDDKDSCAAFCVAEGTWLELMSAVESLASALAAAPEAKP